MNTFLVYQCVSEITNILNQQYAILTAHASVIRPL